MEELKEQNAALMKEVQDLRHELWLAKRKIAAAETARSIAEHKAEHLQKLVSETREQVGRILGRVNALRAEIGGRSE